MTDALATEFAIPEAEFVLHFCQNAPNLMCSGGGQRVRRMPSAMDIIWDLKLQYYCLNRESEHSTATTLTMSAVRAKIRIS